MEYAAQVVDIQKHYDLGTVVVKALRGVSIDFPHGDFVAIMGSSGSGKSTLLNLLGALDRPTHGEYVIGGRSVSTISDDDLSAIFTTGVRTQPSLRPTSNASKNWHILLGLATVWITARFSSPEDSSSVSQSPERW